MSSKPPFWCWPWLVVLWFLGTFLVWLPIFLAGILPVLVCARMGWFRLGTGWQGDCYWFPRVMSLWQTADNGCCPTWYVTKYGPKRPLWVNILIWSAFRNAVGGNPLHAPAVLTQEVYVYGNSTHPSQDSWDHYRQTGERVWKWRFIRRGWRVGWWASKYLGDGDDFRVWDWQYGFKLQTWRHPITGHSRLNFTPWDSGRRTK